MSPEDARIKDVQAWLSKAGLDLRAAAHEISAPEEGLWGDVMFHAQQAAPLTEYAWRFRYPGESDEPVREEAEQALAVARIVYEAILTRMPPEARP